MPHAYPTATRSTPAVVDLDASVRHGSAKKSAPTVVDPVESTATPSMAVALTSTRWLRFGASFLSRLDYASDATPSTASVLEVISGATMGSVSSGQTLYLGLLEDSTETAVAIPVPGGTVAMLLVQSTQAPGSSESYTYTVTKNGSDQTMTVSLSDSDTSAQTSTNPVSFNNGDRVAIKLVTSSGAVTAKHQFSLRYSINA